MNKLYHGSGDRFTKFDKEINWLTNNYDYAKYYALSLRDNGFIYTCEASLNNLFDLDKTGYRVYDLLPITKPFKVSKKFLDAIKSLNLSEDEINKLLDDVNNEWHLEANGYKMMCSTVARSIAFKKVLQAKGYSGIKAIEYCVPTSEYVDTYGLYDASSIKIESVEEIKHPLNSSLVEEKAITWGDLDYAKKTDTRDMMSGRGTGHFGTGFYFVGANGPYGLNGDKFYDYAPDRPIYEIDLDKYKLFRPKDNEDAYRLHDAMRDINNYYSDDMYDFLFGNFDEDRIEDELYAIGDKAFKVYEDLNDDFDEFDIDDLEDIAKDLEDDSSESQDAKDKLYEQTYRELALEFIKKYQLESYIYTNYNTLERWLENSRPGIIEREVKDAIHEKEKYLDYVEYAINNLSKIFNVDKYKLLAMIKANSRLKSNETISTLIFKDLGYEGVDVTHLNKDAQGLSGLDNFGYGTVIYDLKPGTFKKIVDPRKQKNESLNESNGGNTFIYKGKKAWSGAINILDGVIEEVHSYREAENADFNHSFYFSDTQVDKMDEGLTCFFCIYEDHNILVNPMMRFSHDDIELDENFLKKRIKEQVKFIDEESLVESKKLSANSFDMFVTSSVYEAKNILLASHESMRVFIDEGHSIYLMGNIWKCTHSQMVKLARENGYDVVGINDYDTSSILAIYSPKDNQKFTQNDALVDRYEYCYVWENFSFYTRYLPFSKFKLYNILKNEFGKPVTKRLYRESIKEDVEQIKFIDEESLNEDASYGNCSVFVRNNFKQGDTIISVFNVDEDEENYLEHTFLKRGNKFIDERGTFNSFDSIMKDYHYDATSEIVKSKSIDEFVDSCRELLEKIVKKGSKWQVQSEKGRNLGTYNTKKEAEKRLQQVHYFKHMNEEVEIKGDEFSFTLEDICKKYPDLVSSSYQSCGPAFIMPDGKYLLSGKRFDMHGDLAFQCLMDIEGLSEQEIENEFDTSNLTNFFTRFFKLIRVNDGSKGDVEDRAYFVIPYKSITSSQLSALQDFVDYILKNKYSKKIYDIQAFVGTNYAHQKWDLQFNNPTSDEIMNDVKFAMSRGFFGESLNEFFDKLDTYSDTDILATDSAYQLKTVLQRSNEPFRIYDWKGVYYFCNAVGDMTHAGMMEYLFDKGYADGIGFDEFSDVNYMVFIPKNFDTYLMTYDTSLGSDDYYYCRVYDFGVMFVRHPSTYKNSLFEALGEPEREIFYNEYDMQVEITKNGKTTILDANDMQYINDAISMKLDEKLKEDYASKDDILAFVEKNIGTSDTPIDGPSYILPNGKFLTIWKSKIPVSKYSSSGSATHRDVQQYLYNNGLVKDDFWSCDNPDLERLGCIRVNSGFEEYIWLPDDRPNETQWNSLLTWLDWYFKFHHKLMVGFKGYAPKTYRDDDYIPDEILKKCKEAYSRGYLVEKLEDKSIDNALKEFLFDNPISGPTYITPNGKFIDVSELAMERGDDFPYHGLVQDYLRDKKLTDIWGSYDVGSPTLRDLGYIRLNDIEKDNNFIELTKIKPTSKQYEALTKWLDNNCYKYNSINVCSEQFKDAKNYLYRENTVDEIIDKIKRYYATGYLVEGIYEIDEYTKDINNTKQAKDYLLSQDRTTRLTIFERGHGFVDYIFTDAYNRVHINSILAAIRGGYLGKDDLHNIPQCRLIYIPNLKDTGGYDEWDTYTEYVYDNFKIIEVFNAYNRISFKDTSLYSSLGEPKKINEYKNRKIAEDVEDDSLIKSLEKAGIKVSKDVLAGSTYLDDNGYFIYNPGSHGTAEDRISQYYKNNIDIVKKLNKWITFNTITLNSKPSERYILISKKPTNEQYNQLLNWLDRYLNELGSVEINYQDGPTGKHLGHKTYNSSKYLSDDIIKEIKRYFVTGELKEDLSKEQEEYFKNSKIRDKNGNLLVCYHGTENPGFTEFDARKGKSQFGDYKFDNYNINYFTTNKETAIGYTEIGIERDNNVYACYLNIVNPYVVNNKTKDDMYRTWQNIKDETIRNKEIDYFKRFYDKWSHRNISENDLEELNKDLFYFNCKFAPSEDDENYYDLISLNDNTMYGSAHPLMYYYELSEYFDKDNYEEFRNSLVGDYEGEDKEYFRYTIDNLIKWVLLMNEEEGTNYDGIIVHDIYDIGPKGSPFMSGKTTDIITLKSSNQIKRIDNLKPTSSNNINEYVTNKKDVRKNFYNKQMSYYKKMGDMQKDLATKTTQEHEDDFESVVDFCNSLKFPLKVYRGLLWKDKSQVDLDNLGVHWTIDKNFINRNNFKTIIVGEVNEDDVDWKNTQHTYVYYSANKTNKENEIWLMKNAKPHNVKIYDIEEFNKIESLNEDVNKYYRLELEDCWRNRLGLFTGAFEAIPTKETIENYPEDFKDLTKEERERYYRFDELLNELSKIKSPGVDAKLQNFKADDIFAFTSSKYNEILPIIKEMRQLLKEMGFKLIVKELDIDDVNISYRDDDQVAFSKSNSSKYINESKQDIENFKQWAGEDLANRFFNVRNRLKNNEKDVYYWISLENKMYNDLMMTDYWKTKQEQARQYAHRDIIDQLDALVSDIEFTPTKRERDTLAKEGSTKVYEDNEWLVLRIDTYEAAVKYGKGTEWCITGNNSYDGRSDFNIHSLNGNCEFYFYIPKHPKASREKYCLRINKTNRDDWDLYNDEDYIEVIGPAKPDDEVDPGYLDTWQPEDTNGKHRKFPDVSGLPDINKAYEEIARAYGWDKEVIAESLNENKVLRLPKEATNQMINALKDYYPGIHLEELPIDQLVKDNDLLNDDDLQSYHQGEWNHALAKDFHIDNDKMNNIKMSNVPFVTRKKDGTLAISDGRHRTRAAYNDGYTHVEYPLYVEESLHEYDSIVKAELDNLNKWLDKYGFEAELVSDYEFDNDSVGMFLNTIQDNASVFPIALNKDVINNFAKGDKEELVYAIRGTLWHEAGHGIYEFLNDVYELDDEEETVEEFARYKEDSYLFDVLQDYMKQDESLNESKQDYQKKFDERTRAHIERVNKYAKKIDREYPNHDSDKFNELYDGYSLMSKDNVTKEEQALIDDATFKHVRDNEHHCEHWVDEKDIEGFSRDNPTPHGCLDCSKMPKSALEEMCCDWCAMSEEFNNTPFEWYEKNKDTRWHFNEKQDKFILDTLHKLWDNVTLDCKLDSKDFEAK